MHWCWVVSILVFACLLIQDGSGQVADRRVFRANELSRATTSFGFKLYRQLASRDDENIIVSPFSVFAALSMLLLGTDGSTKQQLRDVMAQRDRQGIHNALNSYLNSIPSSPSANVTLRVANALYYDQQRANLLSTYTNNIRRLYQAYPRPFQQPNPESPINDWVLRQTGGKIRDFLNPGDITPDMVVMLLNAVFFQGTWTEIFDERNTREQDFTTASGQVVRVPMMSRDGQYSVKYLGRDLGASVLELPFGTDDRFSLFILLPDQGDGLSDMEARLTPESLEDAVQDMPQTSRYQISVPKFKLKMKSSMKELLAAMGLSHIFTSRADLSRMSSRPLKVSKVMHEAVIEVDEKGATAAAVTSIGVVHYSLPPSFRADHPFLLILRDKRARLNLFMGRLNHPSQQQENGVPDIDPFGVSPQVSK